MLPAARFTIIAPETDCLSDGCSGVPRALGARDPETIFLFNKFTVAQNTQVTVLRYL